MHIAALVAPVNERDCRAAAESLQATITLITRWRDAVTELAGDDAPSVLIVDGDRLVENGPGVLIGLHRRGLLVPTQLYLPVQNSEALRMAWSVPRGALAPVFSRVELCLGLACNRQSDPLLSVAHVLVARLSATGALETLLLLLASRPAARRWSADHVAQELRYGRTRLYDELRSQHAPSLEKLQTLFRLLPAARLIQQGGSLMDAAYRTGYSDESSLRKAFRTRLRVTVRELRQRNNLTWVVDRWMDHAAPPNTQIR